MFSFFSKPYMDSQHVDTGIHGEVMNKDGNFYIEDAPTGGEKQSVKNPSVTMITLGKTISDFLKAAKNYTPKSEEIENLILVLKKIGKLILGLLAGIAIAWTMGLVIPTVIGMKLLASSWTLNSMIYTAKYLLSIQEGQIAYATATAISLYPVSKLFDWMLKPAATETKKTQPDEYSSVSSNRRY